MAAPGGSADIVYDNGCRQRVDSGSVAIVSEDPPCQQGMVPADDASLYGLIAFGAIIGVGAAVIVHNDDDKGASP